MSKILFKIPYILAKGLLGFWYCKIDSLNQTFIDIPKIGIRADQPETL